MSKISKNNTSNDEIYVRLYLSAFRSGLVAKLKATNFTVFMTICSYMNEAGECWPTQEQIAESSGIGKTTVNKSVNELLAFKFKGKPLISRRMVQNGYFKNSVYTIHPISQVAIFGGQVEILDTKESTKNGTKKSTNEIPKTIDENVNLPVNDRALERLQNRLNK
ncbi:helix-turn-helix domain-containing protein [Psychrobacillus sp. NEAU-3TGS]|nr:helix-turn-helix domain-containing protein [Psychrobacillus sp. NEAU-3TGS]